MKIVAKVQFTSPESEGFDAAVTAVDEWASAKLLRKADGSLTIARSGAEALYERLTQEAAGHKLTSFSMLEPISGGSLQTEIRIAASPERTAVSTILSLSSDLGVAPLGVSLRAPKFIRSIVAGGQGWTVGVGGERIFAESLNATDQNLMDLQTLIEFEHRRLPVVIVSEFDEKTLAGDFHKIIANDLCGLAHVVSLNTQAAWELTKQWGAEWSCYNGAVRLFWPMRGRRAEPRAHPLWTRDRIMWRTDDELFARDRLRSALGRQVLEASTFMRDDPAFSEFVKLAARLAADRALEAAANSPQSSKQAYEEQIASLRAEIDSKDAEIKSLNENVAGLIMGMREIRPAEVGLADEESAPQKPVPQSIQEAVSLAKQELKGLVEIASETDADIGDLNPEAGPPEKVLRYLRTLGMLSNRLAQGALGASIPAWLRDEGVECSIDSETTKNSDQGKKFRQRSVNGKIVDCEFHAKPSGKTSPDRCVRIYFCTSETAPHVLVGYIGRHTD